MGTGPSESVEKREPATLILDEGDAQGQCFPISQEKTVIGRGPDCDIILPDRQVSRCHAELHRREDGYVIKDCGSKNGTCVNGRRLDPLEEPYRLQNGDEIQIALLFKLKFVDAGATTPLFLEAETTQVAGVVIDKESRRVWVMGRELDPPLSLAQYHLLELLCDRAGCVCSREDIIKAVWPDSAEDGISEQAIDALARRLRERLAESDPSHQYIVTVRGHGFRLDNGQ
jgi:DNA-binding winged helix-turn-helix (wHTH) protein